MALQAEEPLFAAFQQEVVHAAVRRVASGAALYPNRGMFKNEWPALLHMTLHAGFPIGFCQLIAIHIPVRVMAIRALHEAFGDFMVFGQYELPL
jgi:hypothetical protein